MFFKKRKKAPTVLAPVPIKNAIAVGDIISINGVDYVMEALGPSYSGHTVIKFVSVKRNRNFSTRPGIY